MQVPFGQLPFEVIQELRKRKWTAFFIFTLVSLSILVAGIFWPQKYQAGATIFVDDKNIIRPLMEGSAVATKLPDQSSAIREVVYSRRVLGQLIKEEEIWGEMARSEGGQEEILALLRQTIRIIPRGDNFFTISYVDNDPARTFQVASKLTQLFIAESDSSKREESRSAYEFVDKQVKAYQAQLQASEERLKNFLSENKDGTEADVQARIANLERGIERSHIELRELTAQRAALQAQLQGESRLVSMDTRGSLYRQRLDEMQQRLDSLRLVYHDTYPDIVSLKQQIAELQAALAAELNQPQSTSTPEVSPLNPIYQELRTQIARTEAQIDTVRARERSLQALLEQEHERMARIQTKKAKLAELTRDNEVNREIYNDLLKRRERARVSMRLDVEGQGLSYKVHEPAAYPLAPAGLQFLHFALAGLFVGALAPIGLIVGVLQIDPRVRVASVFEENTGIPVLAAVPHVETPAEHRIHRRRTVLIAISAVGTVVVYVWICWMNYQGALL